MYIYMLKSSFDYIYNDTITVVTINNGHDYGLTATLCDKTNENKNACVQF